MKLVAGTFSVELLPLFAVTDEDWGQVRVLVSANGFNGNIEAWLQLADLQLFRTEVQTMYDAPGAIARAELSSAEPGITLRLDMRPLGSVFGTYAFGSERPEGTPTQLSGTFECDQSYLPSLLQGIAELIHDLESLLSD